MTYDFFCNNLLASVKAKVFEYAAQHIFLELFILYACTCNIFDYKPFLF